MSEQIVLPGVFPRGPYGSAQDVENLKKKRREALAEHDVVCITGITVCRLCHAQDKQLDMPCPEWRKNTNSRMLLARWPSLTAHVICESLGYATPTAAAMILRDAVERKENWCEWIYSCYGRDPLKMLRGCIAYRRNHQGYMSNYKTALVLVMQAVSDCGEPLFASWF